MIPILGIPIVNGFHWLERLVNSIDFPINKLIILNNNSEDIDLTNNLNALAAQKFDYINNIHICHLPSNIGVAASWNLIVKSNLKAPYWLISNHDIAFTPGILERFYKLANDFSSDIIHGNTGEFNQGSYDLFLIKDSIINKIGLFDENFYPAYGEDADYIMRIHNYNILNPNHKINKAFLDIPFFHGENLTSVPDCYHKSGSQTARQNQQLFNKLQNVNIINFEYMNKKWGDEWRSTNPYRFPMNCESIPITYTSYDLEFCRSKNINFCESNECFSWGDLDPSLRDIIKQEIFEEKIYEKYYNIKNNDIILDIGSNCGAFPFSIKDKKIKHVFCLEPSNTLFKVLTNNISNILPCTLINKAIGDTDNDLQIIKESDCIYNHTNKYMSVIKFSTLIKDYNLSSIDLLKFDCESGEFHIFNLENKNFIINNVKNIAGEYHITYFDNSIEYFKIFRDLYLRDLQNTSDLHVFERCGRDVTDEIFNDEYLISFKNWWQANDPDHGQFIIYANFENCKKEKLTMDIFYNDSDNNNDYGIIDTNKFTLNNQQNARLFVVDNFYEDPMAVRNFALSQPYFPGEGAVGYRTRKQFLFDGLKERFEDIIRQKIPDHTDDGYGWRDIGINGRFQYCSAGTNLVYHCDAQHWAAMVFLNPDAPPSAGTSFFRHRETKIYHNTQIDWGINGNQVFNQHTFLDRTPYELTDNVSNVFNRLVIFDGGLIHCASDYFGWDINTSRLFHIFFFN